MKKEKEKNCRLGTVGGQALIEGIMMKSKSRYTIASRLEDGSIKVTSGEAVSLRKKHKFFNIPIIRGIVNMVESFILGYKALSVSAENLGIDDTEPETKFEKWIDKHLGGKMLGIIMTIATVLGLALSLFLFTFLPSVATKGLDSVTGSGLGWFKNLIEGIIKILIFIGYLLFTSLTPDIRRTYQYHGAEHKSIFCYESGKELTPENAKEFKRFHPRCGTSFLFVVLFISILIFSLPFVPWDNVFLRILIKLPLIPLIVGIGFEFLMIAGKHDNFVTRILSAPGLWMQRLTTREPDEKQLEVAIAALKAALPDEFPEEAAAADSAAATEPVEAKTAVPAEPKNEDSSESPEEAKDA